MPTRSALPRTRAWNQGGSGPPLSPSRLRGLAMKLQSMAYSSDIVDMAGFPLRESSFRTSLAGARVSLDTEEFQAGVSTIACPNWG